MRYARIALCVLGTGSASLIHANESSKHYGVLGYSFEQSYLDNYDAASHSYAVAFYPRGLHFLSELPKFPIAQLNATSSIYVIKRDNSSTFDTEIFNQNLSLAEYGVRLVGFDRGLFINLGRLLSTSSEYTNNIDSDSNVEGLKYGIGFGLGGFVVTYSGFSTKVENSFYIGETPFFSNFIADRYLESVNETDTSTVDISYVNKTTSGTFFEVSLKLAKSENNSKYVYNDYLISDEPFVVPNLGRVQLVDSTELSNEADSDIASTLLLSVYPKDDLELLVGMVTPPGGSGELALGVSSFQFDHLNLGVGLQGTSELTRANFILNYFF